MPLGPVFPPWTLSWPRFASGCALERLRSDEPAIARKKLDDEGRRALCDLYLARHDRITTWDMVDRAAPRVVGGHLAGRTLAPLTELARSAAPLKRRTAITAPLYFVKAGSDDDIVGGFAIAATLAADPDPVVHNAVGIFLNHAGTRAPATLDVFLADHADSMPRAAVRLATQSPAPVVAELNDDGGGRARAREALPSPRPHIASHPKEET